MAASKATTHHVLERGRGPDLTPLLRELRGEMQAMMKDLISKLDIKKQEDELTLPPEYSKVTVTTRCMFRLYPLKWLNDNLINFYSQFLSIKHDKEKEDFIIYTTFFYNSFLQYLAKRIQFNNVQRIRSQDIFKKKLVIIPVNVDNDHWITVILTNLDHLQEQLEETSGSTTKIYVPNPSANVPKPCIIILDSLKRQHTQVFNNMKKFIELEYNRLNSETIDVRKMAIKLADTPQQDNESDCGVFTIQNMEKALMEIKKFRTGMPYLKLWYPRNFIGYKRLEIMKIIINLVKSVNQNDKR